MDNRERLAVRSRQLAGLRRFFNCLFLLTTYSLLFTSCFEPEDGCLNLNATNYDVTADENCTDCCTFPTLNLSLRHVINLVDTTVFFRYDSMYPVPENLTDSFSIERIRYFLSDVRLVKSDGEEVRVRDSINVDIDGQMILIEDSFVKADRDLFRTVEIGTVITQGNFNRLRFRVGLIEDHLGIDPNSVPAESQLFVENDTLLFIDTLNIGYLSGLIVYNTPMNDPDSTVVQFFNQTEEIEVIFDEVIELDPGFDFDLTLQVDYLEWFRGSEIISASEGIPSDAELDPLRSLFLENIAQSFTFFANE